MRSAVLILLAATAVVWYFLGDSLQAIIIGVILAASIGLGFVNEYRAERAAAAPHSGVRHPAVARRDGTFVAIESILTGESMGSEKSTEPVPVGAELAESTDLAFMGTIVSAGEGTGVVYATGRECCRSIGVTAFPANASEPDSAQQSAL